MEASERAAVMEAALRAAGYKLTEDRRALIEDMSHRDRLVSIGDLIETGAQLGVSRPTVFRLLDVLVEQKLAVRFTKEGGSRTYYTFCTPDHHHHVICTNCGRVEPVEAPYLEKELSMISALTGYDLDRHNLELFGLCPECRAGGQRPSPFPGAPE